MVAGLVALLGIMVTASGFRVPAPGFERAKKSPQTAGMPQWLTSRLTAFALLIMLAP